MSGRVCSQLGAWNAATIMPTVSPAIPPRSTPIVLSFAASDPTGGAGVQADILTLASLGCHPATVITALTVQDTAGVEAVMPIDADWIADQARALLEDMPAAAFKLGMLGTVEAIAAIAEIVSDYPDVPLVFDPVLASGRGDQFANEDMIDAMLELLLPQTTVLTPNSLEARRLAASDEDAETPGLAECAHRLLTTGCSFVLVTGTHEHSEQVLNTLYDLRGVVRNDRWPRLPGSYHGSGCTLASAIAAHLALGLTVDEAVAAAQAYTWRSLKAGFRPGMGQFLPNRFWQRDEN